MRGVITMLPAAQADVDGLHRRKELGHTRLLHPVAHEHRVTTAHEQDVDVIEGLAPILLTETLQDAQFQHADRFPTGFDHGGSSAARGIAPDAVRPTHGVPAGRDRRRVALFHRLAGEFDEHIADTLVLEARRGK